MDASVLTNRCKCPKHERQIVYKILGALNLACFRTCSTRQPSVFRGIDAGGNFASKLLEPLYNHPTHQPRTIPRTQPHPPLNQPPHTLNHSLYLLSPHYSSTPVPIHPLYYLLYVLYLCYSLLFITDYVPAPYFFLSTYNFNCQTITMCPPCLFL